MTCAVAGSRSTIARAFAQLARSRETVELARLADTSRARERYFITTGYLAGRALLELGPADAALTWERNFLEVARFCDEVFDRNEAVRIVVLGSESGFAGSHDMAYAGAKAALHRYVETKRLRAPAQMLVALAPHVVWDTNMTQERDDLGALRGRSKVTRLGRWLTALEVAREAYHLLYDASPSLSGQVIRMRVE